LLSSGVDWFEDFFFKLKDSRHRGGAIRLLSGRIDSLRAGKFEKLGLPRTTRVYPIIVTYDDLCAWEQGHCRPTVGERKAVHSPAS
jgi:hypothetical protein